MTLHTKSKQVFSENVLNVLSMDTILTHCYARLKLKENCKKVETAKKNVYGLLVKFSSLQ